MSSINRGFRFAFLLRKEAPQNYKGAELIIVVRGGLLTTFATGFTICNSHQPVYCPEVQSIQPAALAAIEIRDHTLPLFRFAGNAADVRPRQCFAFTAGIGGERHRLRDPKQPCNQSLGDSHRCTLRDSHAAHGCVIGEGLAMENQFRVGVAGVTNEKGAISALICCFYDRINWRLRSESNRRPRLCRPLHNHSATQPSMLCNVVRCLTGKTPDCSPGFHACFYLERETRFELATPTLARLCSTS
jgi:hypothetical protein